jgi:hypothetical protein
VPQPDHIDAGLSRELGRGLLELRLAAGDDGPRAVRGDGLDDGDGVTVAGGLEHGRAHAEPVIVDVGADDDDVEFLRHRGSGESSDDRINDYVIT